jgi:hypothetical protein
MDDYYEFNKLWNTETKIYQTLLAPTNALFYILCILMLICSCTFRRNRHLQGAYTNVVKMFSAE